MSNYTCKHDYVSVPPDKHDCPECLATNKPAQSGAPSAPNGREWVEKRQKAPVYTLTAIELGNLLDQFAEAYAALRTAKMAEQLAELKLQVTEMARDIHKANVLRNSAESALSEARTLVEKLLPHSGLCCKFDANNNVIVTEKSCHCSPDNKKLRALLAGASGAAGKGGAE